MSALASPSAGDRASDWNGDDLAPRRRMPAPSHDPLNGLRMRLTYRTMRVLLAIGEHPGGSNRGVGRAAGVHDQGQISKLLSRLKRLGLIENEGDGASKGAPNSWILTPRGSKFHETIASEAQAWISASSAATSRSSTPSSGQGTIAPAQ
jgi:DNA-binding MarR family transcriptional regulator